MYCFNAGLTVNDEELDIRGNVTINGGSIMEAHVSLLVEQRVTEAVLEVLAKVNGLKRVATTEEYEDETRNRIEWGGRKMRIRKGECH
jgi:hypothetical protein